MLTLVWQRLDHGARLALPFVTTLAFLLLGAVAWPLPHFGEVAPSLALIAVYYWTLHRPDLFRPWMAFVIGFLNDVIHFLPLGVSALVFVGAHQLVLTQRRFFVGHSFFMLWCGFALTMIAVVAATWLLDSVMTWQWAPFFPVLLQAMLAVIIFPLPAWLMIRMQRGALSQG